MDWTYGHRVVRARFHGPDAQLSPMPSWQAFSWALACGLGGDVLGHSIHFRPAQILVVPACTAYGFHAFRLAILPVSRYYIDMLRFDWDERKNESNRIKHGIWFEEAQSVFSDPRGRLFYDPEHSEREDRFLLPGLSSASRTLVVVHCYRENDSVVRIISARKAAPKEVRFYEEGI